MRGQGMDAARFLIAPYQGLIRSLDEDDFVGNAFGLEVFQALAHGVKEFTAPDIGDEGHVADPFAAFDAQFRELGNQDRRDIVDAEIANVFQYLDGMALTGTGHAGDNDQMKMVHKNLLYRQCYNTNFSTAAATPSSLLDAVT